LRRTIISFSCITKFSSFSCIICSLFCQALFSLFCPAIISFSCVTVQEAATDCGKRVVGSKTTYFVLSYKLRFFLSEAQENRVEYLANALNLHNVVRKNIQDWLDFYLPDINNLKDMVLWVKSEEGHLKLLSFFGLLKMSAILPSL